MANSGGVGRGGMETVTDFIFLVSKITTNGKYSHEIKRCLVLGRKAMTNLDSILKNRDITLLTNFADSFEKTLMLGQTYSQSYGFSSSHVGMSKLDHKEG